MKRKTILPGVTSFFLHIIAMVFMLCDHLWASVIPGNDFLTCIGRMAFPIFAFLTVEGYFHTSDLRKYLTRLLIFAVISEIPFNLLCGSFLYPFHQNVLWTFIIAILMMRLCDRAKAFDKVTNIRSGMAKILAVMLILLIGCFCGQVLMVDYGAVGILTVMVFYFFRGRSFINAVLTVLLIGYMNMELVGGLVYEFGSISIPRQAFALVALIPIFLYNGKRGYHSKKFTYFCYAFYPLHMLILGLMARYI